jgi:hypothetical protein
MIYIVYSLSRVCGCLRYSNKMKGTTSVYFGGRIRKMVRPPFIEGGGLRFYGGGGVGRVGGVGGIRQEEVVSS